MSNQKLTKMNDIEPLVFKYKKLNFYRKFKRLVTIFLSLLLGTYFGVEFYKILDEKPQNYHVYPMVPFGFKTLDSNQNNSLYLCIDKKELNDTSIINSCFNHTDFRYVSNDLVENFSKDLVKGKPNEPFTFRIGNDNSKIGMFTYDLVFKKKRYYYKKISNSKFAYLLYKIFGDGFWVKQGEFLIKRNDLVYSSNVKVSSAKKDCMRVCIEYENVKNFKFTLPTLYDEITKDGRLIDPTIELIQDYLRYAVPTNYDAIKNHDFIRTRRYSEITVPPISTNAREPSWKERNSQLSFKVSGKKHHKGEVFIGKIVFNNDGDAPLKMDNSPERIDSEVIYSDNNEFTLSVSINPKSHGIVLYYLVNIISKEESVITAQPIFYSYHDLIGPRVSMGYNVNNTDYVTDEDGSFLGKASIEVGDWYGFYKPLTVRLSGDIEQLFIDGKRFSFNPKENPQEIFRRFGISDFVGHNRTKIKAFDSAGNETNTFWEFSAKIADD
tara:strand:+ start:942 stop:2426 length:1485 start_codon:yes stop_codon:yes gene_type:complete